MTSKTDLRRRPSRAVHRQEPTQRSPRDRSSGARRDEREGCRTPPSLLPRSQHQGLSSSSERLVSGFRIRTPTSFSQPIPGLGLIFRIRIPASILQPMPGPAFIVRIRLRTSSALQPPSPGVDQGHSTTEQQPRRIAGAIALPTTPRLGIGSATHRGRERRSLRMTVFTAWTRIYGWAILLKRIDTKESIIF